MTVHLVIPDQHAHPNTDFRRASYLGKLIGSLRPDVVINIGDAFDMASLCSYDRNTRSFEGRRYDLDVSSGIEFQDRIWHEVKSRKKKMPRRVFLVGNHEHRINKLTQLHPELHGKVSLKDLQLEHYYDEVVEYQGTTPGVITIDGIDYAHYFISGLKGLAISGVHPAYSLLSKRHRSSTCGHTHLLDWNISPIAGTSKKLMGCFAGCYTDLEPTNASDYAGLAEDTWWKGIVIKDNVNPTDGSYDPRFISLKRIMKAGAKENV